MSDLPDYEPTSTLTLGAKGTESAPGGEGLVLLYAPRLDGLPSAVGLPEGQALVLGRDPPPGGARLPFSSASRVHAKVFRSGAQVVIEDLDSRNGTFVNGSRIRSSVLEDGDEVRVGEVMVKYVASAVESYAAFPLEGIAPAPPMERLRGGHLMTRVREQIQKAGKGLQPVLVTGETGTGKELVAEAFHRTSARSGKLCAVNCAAIPANLLESELFGYMKGAFTGADAPRLGLVRSAHQGTLFLDEIGDMPLESQAKLLRLLETREVTPLGSHKSESVDVRVVCATHRDLPAMVRAEKFRGDLYARIAGYCIELPPLRERKEDIYQLTRLFMENAGQSALELRPAFVLALLSHDWPFNVRELLSAIQRAITLASGALGVEQLPAYIASELESPDRSREASGRPSVPAPEEVAARTSLPTEAQLRESLTRHAGNLAAVAREFRKDRTQVHRWLKRYGIALDEFRS